MKRGKKEHSFIGWLRAPAAMMVVGLIAYYWPTVDTDEVPERQANGEDEVKHEGQKEIRRFTNKDLGARLEVLVREHPDPVVHDILADAIGSDEILLRYEELPGGTAAEFGYAPIIPEAQQAYGLPPFMPTLKVNPQMLMYLDEDRDWQIARLSIYHEAVHYRQWLDADDGGRQYFRSDMDPGSYSEEHCRVYWENEYEAYALECQMARRMGRQDFLPELCGRVDDDELFGFIMYGALRDNYAVPMGIEQCVPVWAELSGAGAVLGHL